MRLSATIEDPQAIRKILAHLGLPSEVPTSPHPGPLRHARLISSPACPPDPLPGLHALVPSVAEMAHPTLAARLWQADPSPPQASAPSVVRFRLDSLLTRGLSCPVAGRIRTLFIRPVSSGAVGVASVPGVWTDNGLYAAYSRLPALSAVTPAPLEGAAGVALLENRDPARVEPLINALTPALRRLFESLAPERFVPGAAALWSVRRAPIEVAPDRGENHSKSP